MKKCLILTLILISLQLLVDPVMASTSVSKRKPDQTEFVTESHVRIAPEYLTVAEVQVSTSSTVANPTYLDYLSQSLTAFLKSLRDIFN